MPVAVSRRTIYVIVSTIMLVLLFCASLYQLRKDVKILTNQAIVDDVAQLAQILHTINQDCGILSFAHERNYIDFLNVRSFEGSEVGCLNLANPRAWKGPYLIDNLTIQAKVYEIVKAADGFYIVPGAGVRMADGRVIGTDVLITSSTHLASISPTDPLWSWSGKLIFAPVKVHELTPHRWELADSPLDG